MKIAVFDDYRIGIVDGSDLIDVTEACPSYSNTWPPVFMLPFIEEFTNIRPKIEDLIRRRSRMVALRDVHLRPPVPMPTKILAAPVNYQRHQKEMTAKGAVYEGMVLHTVAQYGVFLKPSSSLVGSDSVIELPFSDRRTDHEAELAVVIGRRGRNIRREEAYDYVFGYTGLMDITVRGHEDRTYRKGFDGFTPMGPYVVTKDEMSDPQHIGLELTVDGEVRQVGNTEDLIFDIPRLIEAASFQTTLYPGDIISTGTPEGVGPIRAGNTVRLTVEGIGELVVRVSQGHPDSRRGLDI